MNKTMKGKIEKGNAKGKNVEKERRKLKFPFAAAPLCMDTDTFGIFELLGVPQSADRTFS